MRNDGFHDRIERQEQHERTQLTQAAMRLSGVKPRLVGGTLFVALPVALQRTIEGGCQCRYCVAHPNETPMWDTLAIDAKAQRHTWTVHYPEMRAWR